MSWYRTRVERDLAGWQAAGWVSEAGASAIRADLAARKPALGAASVLAILGAVLFGFAVMSFVAANWNAMSKLARLLLLLAALWACYGGAAYLFARQLMVFAHAAVLGGIAVYGASIMLIAQMYHMDGNPPDAVLMWALGALLAAVLARSNAALAATFVLLAVWTGWNAAQRMAHWLFLPPWAVSAAVAAWLTWRPGLHLAALSLASLAGSSWLLRARQARPLGRGGDRRGGGFGGHRPRRAGHRPPRPRLAGHIRLRRGGDLRGALHDPVHRRRPDRGRHPAQPLGQFAPSPD